MYRFAKSVLLPPTFPFCIVFFGAGLALAGIDPGGIVVFAGLGLLYLCSIPLVGLNLLALLRRLATDIAAETSAGAIIVLSGDLKEVPAALSSGGAGTDLGSLSIERVRHGARLHRSTGLPTLVSGGAATIMASVLSEEFGVAPVWIEDESRRTAENAARSAAQLSDRGIETAYIVTQDWHMARALRAFRRTGLVALPAPASHSPAVRPSPPSLMPSVAGVTACHYAVYELLGLLQQGLLRR